MCNDHEHYTELATDKYNKLCFRHAVLESLQGHRVDMTTQSYATGNNDCDVCDMEELTKYLDDRTLAKRCRFSNRVTPADETAMYKDFADNADGSDPKSLKKVLEKGNPVATETYAYQYLTAEELNRGWK